MATSPTPALPAVPVSISIADPVSADIQAISGAVVALCTFGSTPMGQKLLQVELDAGKAIGDTISGIFAKLHALLFHGAPKP